MQWIEIVALIYFGVMAFRATIQLRRIADILDMTRKEGGDQDS